jgi:hypothetical protein
LGSASDRLQDRLRDRGRDHPWGSPLGSASGSPSGSRSGSPAWRQSGSASDQRRDRLGTRWDHRRITTPCHYFITHPLFLADSKRGGICASVATRMTCAHPVPGLDRLLHLCGAIVGAGEREIDASSTAIEPTYLLPQGARQAARPGNGSRDGSARIDHGSSASPQGERGLTSQTFCVCASGSPTLR